MFGGGRIAGWSDGIAGGGGVDARGGGMEPGGGGMDAALGVAVGIGGALLMRSVRAGGGTERGVFPRPCIAGV